MPNYNPPKEIFFTTDRKESCTDQINVRVPPSVKEKLKKVDGWHEEVRKILARLVELESA